MLKSFLLSFSLPVFAFGATCYNFSGTYKHIQSGACMVIEQNDCGHLKMETHESNKPVSGIDFITDGVFRRYVTADDSEKSIKHDTDGSLFLVSYFDNGLKESHRFSLRENGILKNEVFWYDPSEDNFIPSTKYWTRFSDLSECQK